jgi:hypothetical protein
MNDPPRTPDARQQSGVPNFLYLLIKAAQRTSKIAAQRQTKKEIDT